MLFLQEFQGNIIAVFPKTMTISTDMAIAHSMSRFVPKCWLNCKVCMAILNEFLRQRWDHSDIDTCLPSSFIPLQGILLLFNRCVSFSGHMPNQRKMASQS